MLDTGDFCIGYLAKSSEFTVMLLAQGKNDLLQQAIKLADQERKEVIRKQENYQSRANRNRLLKILNKEE